MGYDQHVVEKKDYLYLLQIKLRNLILLLLEEEEWICILNFFIHCCYEAFKLLAKNYLDATSHHFFETIRRLLEETKMMNLADVVENLIQVT